MIRAFMSQWTRRDLLKGGLAASVGALATNAALPESASAATEETWGAEAAAAAAAGANPAEAPSPRERSRLDRGWRFHLGHANDPAKDFGFGAAAREATFAKADDFRPVAAANFNDRSWRSVDLPHDWAVELPFQNGVGLAHHGAKPIGRDYPESSIGWYRRVFEIPASDAGKRLAVEFDGVFRRAMVIFNGHYLGENDSGYAPFRLDLTDLAEPGARNVLVVRVDATLGEGWFYEGAGIYRHVWLSKTSPLHLAYLGTYVRSDHEPRGGAATVTIGTEVVNESETARTCRVIGQVIGPDGGRVAMAHFAPARLAAWGSHSFQLPVAVPRPQLWSIDTPSNLYHLITTVESDGKLTDREVTTFGIRTIRFDPEQGFLLNGKRVKIKGTCNHQDHAGVGVALPDRLHGYRVKRLQEMGANAYRTAHNPVAPELLDACDRLGMMVMAETRMMSSSVEGLSQLERMIRRDRNHPSIVIWSLGNEEEEDQGKSRGARIVASMKRRVRQLDPHRPVTVAMNGDWGEGVSAVVDVQGCNYKEEIVDAKGRVDAESGVDAFHRKHPSTPMIGSETAGAFSTRGVYDETVRANAYGRDKPAYARTAEDWWKFYVTRSFLVGGFAWTGFDYRGEPSPHDWPYHSSHFGAMDTCGFPKDTYYYYQAWWGPDDVPVLHLFPHWNWAGHEGREIPVWCHTNLDSVELFRDGESQGVRKVERYSHAEWKVQWHKPGVIEARGSKQGRVVLTSKRETTGPPAKLLLEPDRQSIKADGEDVAIVTVKVGDAAGRLVPDAARQVVFQVAGPGRLIGVGNGDPSCLEADKGDRRTTFNGLCMALVQSTGAPGRIRLTAVAGGLQGAATVIEAEPPPLHPAVP
jgi:beta-galactosidase